MKERRAQEQPSKRYRVALLAAVFSVAGTALVGAVGTGVAPAATNPTAQATCASTPVASGCALTGLSVDTSALTACGASCAGVEVLVGETVDLPVDGTYNDGSSGPLSILAGSAAPGASFSVEPQPSGVITLTGVVNSAGAADEVELTASAPTSAPGTVAVSYLGLEATSAPLNALVVPTCGQQGQPACTPVSGALLDVSAAVLTGTASVAAGPVSGAVVDIVQAGAATGSSASDQPCYPEGSGTGDVCGPVPSGSPATASPATCTTDSSGTCPLTAMWDGAGEDFAGPDVVTMYPPAGYVLTGVTGCTAVTGDAAGPVCDLAPADWSQPLGVTFDLAPEAVVTVDVAGPAEPCPPGDACSPASSVYDNAALDQEATAAITPTGGSAGSPLTCSLAGGTSGSTANGQAASCSVSVPPGTYTVSLPASITTPDSPVGVPLAYVTGADPQALTAAAGGAASVSFSTAYEPALTVDVAGPAEPCLPPFCTPGEDDTVYDNDAVDGTVVTVTPTGSTTGAVATCTLDNGSAGDATYGQDAFCTVYVPPGTYSVSLPPSIQTANSEVDIPFAYVTGTNPQAVTLDAGAWSALNFTTGYQPIITVEVAGPLEPSCTTSSCAADALVYDNDAIDGATATVTPAAGTAGTAQACQLAGGYPGDNSDYGEDASCTVEVAPGTYEVSLPTSMSTPDSEVGIPLAYVNAPSSQSVTVGTGDAPDVQFSTSYEPSLDVTLAGPLEPTCDYGGTGSTGTPGTDGSAASCPDEDVTYDNDAVNGTTVTVTPVDGTPGSAQVCQVAGGEPGNNADGVEATCLVGVPPGTYSVAVPRRIAPDPDYGWGYIDVTGTGSQVVTVVAGAPSNVTFTTSYETMDHVGSGAGSAHTTDGLLTATADGGSGTVTVGEYSTDPEGAATFDPYSTDDDFFDVAVAPGSTFTKVVFTICGLTANSNAVYWWDPVAGEDGEEPSGSSIGQWVPLAPATAATSRKAGCLTVTLTESTEPSVAQLSGTVFAVPESLPAQRVTFASPDPSPVAVGAHYTPEVRSSADLPVDLVVGNASTKGSCTVSAAGVVNFTGAGKCDVQADQVGSTRWAAASATQVVEVSAGRPVALGATYSTGYRKTLDVAARNGLLARDTLNGAVLSSHTPPAHGTLSLRPNGAFSYVPRASFSGTDSFSYTLKNALGRATATVTIHVGSRPFIRKPARAKSSR